MLDRIQMWKKEKEREEEEEEEEKDKIWFGIKMKHCGASADDSQSLPA